MNDDKPDDVNDIMETIRKAVIFGKAMPGGPADSPETAADESEPEPEPWPAPPESGAGPEPEAEPLLLADALPDDEPARDAAEPAVGAAEPVLPPPPPPVQMASPPPLAPDAAPPPVVIPGATTLESLVSAALEPLLRAWIDANLPDIVETRVQAEIARLTAR